MTLSDDSVTEATMSLSKGNKFALVVGVNNSVTLNAREQLQHAEQDASDIAWMLRETACDFSLIRPVLRGSDAKTWKVQQAIIDLAAMGTEQDFLLFYFSGHAQPIETPGGHKDIYLVTYNFRENDVKFSPTMHISMRWLRDMLYNKAQAGAVLLILDCCYAGNIIHSGVDPYHIDLGKLIEDWLEEPDLRVQKDRPRAMLTATGYNVTAQEKDGHGLMTRWILRALHGDDDKILDDTGHLDVFLLHRYLKNKMPEQSPNLAGEFGLYPWILASYPPQPANDPLPREPLEGKPGAITFDSTICQEAPLDPLDEEWVRRFLTQKKIQQLRDAKSNLDVYGQPRQIAFLHESPSTYAALLCFGKYPSKTVTGAYTRCTYWKGKTRGSGWREDLECTAGLFEQYEVGCHFLKQYLHLQRVIDHNGSKEEWEIPPRVLEEAVANALIHREYASFRSDFHPNPVHIEIYDDRIEISSPGEPLLPIGQLGVTGESRQRNPLIAHIFYLNGQVEKVGSGIQRMQDLLQEAHLPFPEFQLSSSKTFKVIVRRPVDPQEAELIETKAELIETQRRHRKFTNRTKVLSGLMALLVFLSGGGAWYYSYLHPDPTRVTTLKDSGPGSLRHAVDEAQTGAMITFDPNLQGIISLTSGSLDLNKNMTLQGSKLGNISISNAISPGLHDYIISIAPAATVTFENLTFTSRSNTPHHNALIQNQGHLILNSCSISHNTSDGRGGGLVNLGGSVMLNHTDISNNAAGKGGGGIYNWNGSLTLTNSTLFSNHATYNGGGIFSLLGSITILDSTVKNNETTSQNGNSSTGGGIALINSLLILNTIGSGSTRNIIQGNSTQGSGGGIALLGSQALIKSATITGNHAGLSGGGMAVEKDTENDKVGLAIITDSEITNAPIENTAPDEPGILGTLRTDSSNPLIVSVSSSITGNPAPYPFPPEQSNQYRGAVDLNAFCQSRGYSEFQFPTPYNPFVLSCIASAHPAMTFTPLQACKDKAQTADVMARLADYYDPSSWQCYIHEMKLGKIATQANMNGFCKLLSQGKEGVKVIGKTAYDWQCDSSSGVPVGLSMANACQWFYHRTDAFDSLVDFDKLSGWECWAPSKE